MYNLNGGHLLGCCFYFAMPWLPASAQTSLYAQFLSTEFKAPSSFSNYIGGVKTLHIMLEQTFQCFTAIELKMALRGIARLNPHCPQQAEPIIPDILWAIYRILDLSLVDNVVFWSLFTLAFFLFQRKSNLVVSRVNKSPVRRCDIIIVDHSTLDINNPVWTGKVGIFLGQCYVQLEHMLICVN